MSDATVTAEQAGSGEGAAKVGPRRRRTYSAGAMSGPRAVIRDLTEGFAMGPVWRAFAWDEIQHRYRRSALGLAWIVVSYLIWVAAIAIFFKDFNALGGNRFTMYVALGYAAFTFLIGNVTDGCEVFRTSANWIKSTPLPYSIYIYKSIARSSFVFAIQLLTSILVMAALGWRPPASAIWAAPAIVVFFLNAVWLQLFFGLVAARWRDISHLVGAITRILFFMTPILWVYGERGGAVRIVSEINPLTHFLAIFRAPMLGTELTPYAWAHVGAWTIGGWVLAIAAGSVMRRRLPFWV